MVEIKPFKNQDYVLLKSQHSASNLFVDTEFPANIKSLSHTGKPPRDDLQWKRPKEVFPNPQLVVDGIKRSDLNQGSVGNCWFIAACAAVTLNPDLLERVVPQDQSFDENSYAGIFHFRFWRYGIWYDVVIDDQLPFTPDNKLFYLHNDKDPNELWAPLLEKAYAKVCGSYEVMEGGMTTDGLIDMTAGVDEMFLIVDPNEEAEKPPNFKEKVKAILQQGYTRKSMLGCGINADPTEKEAPIDNGLIKGHAYSITRVKDVTTKNGETVTLIRCRNPWGEESEWNGDWSDNSKLWDTVSDEEKARLKYRQKHDGEFWMSFDDFYSNFHDIEICHRGPSSLQTTEGEEECIKWSDIFDNQTTWKEEAFHGEWIPGQTAGGRYDEANQVKFWANPQYLVKLTATDDVIFAVDDKEEKVCTMLVSLIQKETRERIVKGETVDIYIHFDVFRVKDDVNVMQNIENGKLKFYMSQLEPMESTGAYSPRRGVTKRCHLPAGTYVIIPSTFDSDEAAKFLLRIFTEKEVDQTVKAELDLDKKNLTEADVTFSEKDLADFLDGVCKLIDEVDGPSPNKDPKKPSNTNTAISKKKPAEKEELCSIQ